MSHILVVDDNPLDRELARGLLEQRSDFHVEFASNGMEAIEHLEESTPLTVVTDLQMPSMDGLALVKEMRHRFPTIPVVLMTAFGSEDIAVEALVQGAADFVPKHLMASKLLRTVENILSVDSGDRRHEQITRFVCYKKLRYELPSDPDLIAPLADQLQQAAANLGLVDSAERLRLAKCLVEALRNAVFHGGEFALQASPAGAARQVIVEVEFTPFESRYLIRDQGAGFDASTVLDPRRNPANLTADKGRGLTLIQLFMDEVRFNPAGNEILMVKRQPVSS